PGTVLSGIVDVAGGREHVLALSASGDVYAWGGDVFGQVGNRLPFANTQSPTLVLTGAARVAAGHLHSLALMTGGGVRAWGDNDKGQVGPAGGTKRKAAAPLAVSGLPAAATQVAAGRAHSLALVNG